MSYILSTLLRNRHFLSNAANSLPKYYFASDMANRQQQLSRSICSTSMMCADNDGQDSKAQKAARHTMRKAYMPNTMSAPTLRFRRQGALPEITGVSSENASLTLKTIRNFDDVMPTSETLMQKFDGIRFDELPIVHLKVSPNNTLVTITDHKNIFIAYTSMISEGFKNAKKKSAIAGQTVGIAAGQRLLRRGLRTVRVRVRGFGPGRANAIKGLTNAGVHVVSITDFTPIKEIGPRPRKARRI